MVLFLDVVVFFFKQKAAYEVRISDWSSDVCSSDLPRAGELAGSLGSLLPYAGIPALCGCRVDRQGTLAPACPILPPLGPQMPRKHRGRHPQPMGANIKGKPGQLACSLPTSIPGAKSTDIEALPPRPSCTHSIKRVKI